MPHVLTAKHTKGTAAAVLEGSAERGMGSAIQTTSDSFSPAPFR